MKKIQWSQRTSANPSHGSQEIYQDDNSSRKFEKIDGYLNRQFYNKIPYSGTDLLDLFLYH